MEVEPGVLYVVATPIGNLADMTYRAVDVLRQVDLILSEDTRRTRVLLSHYGIGGRLQAFHEHNEAAWTPLAIDRLRTGQTLALVSDAGTPLLSDPGFSLVREARDRGLPVVPLPGPNAAICALSASGLAATRVLFLGFPPRAGAQRRRWLASLAHEPATLVIYESAHRVLDTLADAMEAFGGERPAVLARELTKLHETFLTGDLGRIRGCVEADPNQRKGEFVLLVEGKLTEPDPESVDAQTVLRVLAAELPTKHAAAVAAAILGGSRKAWYGRLLALRGPETDA